MTFMFVSWNEQINTFIRLVLTTERDHNNKMISNLVIYDEQLILLI